MRTEGYEWAWGDHAMDRLIEAFDLSDDVQRLVLTFTTHLHPTLEITWSNGNVETRVLPLYGIKAVGDSLEFPCAMQEIVFTVERGLFVESRFRCMPRQDPFAKIFALLKEGEPV